MYYALELALHTSEYSANSKFPYFSNEQLRDSDNKDTLFCFLTYSNFVAHSIMLMADIESCREF